MIVSDINRQRQNSSWGPIGRFGWKYRHHNSPFSRIIDEANAMGENWGPIKAGLFGGKLARFTDVVNEYSNLIVSLRWS
ncbi:MAG: hypothetical protein AAGA80_28590 [Cyanobacteria bacterium P01_F01_bin.143]